MNRNILLARRQNKKKQAEMFKKLKEHNEKLKEQMIDPDKFNPDIPIKYQDDKNKRKSIIKPSNFKINTDKIIDEKVNLNKDLEKLLQERNEKVAVPSHKPVKRILGGLTGSYNDQKDTIKEMKIEMDKKKEKGKAANDAILSYYN